MSELTSARIVHVVATASGWGGLERAGVEVATAQARHGMDVVLVASSDVCARLPGGVRSVAFDFSPSRHNPFFVWKLVQCLGDLKVNILHVHANKGAALGKAVRPFLSEVKVVATIHNTKKNARVFEGLDAVVAVSRMAGASLGGIKHTVIWNAIALPKPVDPPADLPGKVAGHFTIAAYGRFVEAKGFDLLLEAIAPLDGVDLWLVGDGQLRRAIERQMTTLALEDRIWMPGFRSDAEAIVSHSDLFVLPSRHEGFPFTLVEMLHREMPVVACRVAGAEEILPEECLLDIGDIEALRQRILWAKTSRAEHLALMQPVFELAREKLEIGGYCKRLNAVYEKTL